MTRPSLISHYFDVNNCLRTLFILPQGYTYSLIHLFQKGRQRFLCSFNFELTFLIIGLRCNVISFKNIKVYVLLLEIKIPVNRPCI